MGQPIVVRTVQRTSQMRGDWDVVESCERYYWNRAGAASRKGIFAKFLDKPRRAAIAVSIAEGHLAAVREQLRATQGITYLGWTEASGQSFALLHLPNPAPAALIGEILSMEGVLELEPDRDRTADYYKLAPEISTRFDNACEPACPEQAPRTSLRSLELQESLRALTPPVLGRPPRAAPYVIAIIDDGVQWNHPYLAAHLWRNPKEMTGECAKDDDGNGYINDCIGWNFHASSSDPRPSWGWSHGTQSAGLIVAVANNADVDVRIMALRTQGSGSRLPLSGLIDAIKYASNHGARTILLAQRWALDRAEPGDQEKIAMFERAIELAGHRNCLLVCAAGNGREDISMQRCEPASSGLTLPHVLTAQGVGPGFSSSAFASKFPNELIVAPAGNDIHTITVKADRQARFGGTSAAAALIAGASAVVATYKGITDAAKLKARLLSCRNPAAIHPTPLEPRLIDLKYLSNSFA